MSEIVETVLISLISAFFASLSAVFFAKYVDFIYATRGLKQEIQTNHDICIEFKTLLNEQLSGIKKMKITKHIKIPSFYVSKLNNSSYQYCSVNGYLMRTNSNITDKLIALGSIVDVINQFIEKQDKIIFMMIDQSKHMDIDSFSDKNSFFSNLCNNMKYLIDMIDKFEETYNKAEIQLFIK